MTEENLKIIIKKALLRILPKNMPLKTEHKRNIQSTLAGKEIVDGIYETYIKDIEERLNNLEGV
ncbi:MAG: hypothetical protein ISS28_05180 [Candidatus Cloacimonetes bacterium]|nr:hypothetical protein [Actinomycetota bacterium]MBL7086474.1 hypothetical protein [Candidatus Cloacimonadota bacterium]